MMRFSSVFKLLPTDVFEILSLWTGLCFVALRLKALPYEKNRALLFAPPNGPLRELSEKERERALYLLHQTCRASRLLPGYSRSCLRRALVLRARLEREGVFCRLVYGAAKNTEIIAHAWLEAGSLILDPLSSGQYKKFTL